MWNHLLPLITRTQVKTHRMRPSTHAHDRHLSSIAAKGSDIISHPLKQHALVPQPQVQTAFPLGGRGGREPEGADAVVEAHGQQRRLGPADEAGHVPLGATAGVEGAPVDVNDDGKQLVGVMVGGGSVHVEVQAILPFPRIDGGRGGARTHGPERVGLDMTMATIVRWQGDRRPEAVGAACGLRVGYAPPCLDVTRHTG